MSEVARKALELLHFDPETGDDQSEGEDRCESACYDCLMGYYNQRDHEFLDRMLVKEYLLPNGRLGRQSLVRRSVTVRQYQRLVNLTDSGLERGFLKHVYDGEYRLPSDAQRMFDQCHTRPDFIYDEQRTVVYIDGPHHQYPERAERDARQTEDLEDLGWTVIRIDDDDWGASSASTPNIFGGGEMSHAVGSLVKCRGREWVVLPDAGDDPDLLMLRPLGGTEDEVCGIYLPLEAVEPASFDLPDPTAVGDHLSCRLLRDAVRLGFRASAGPFRSFGKIACEPRPYQLVPLMMALRLDPIRLLIADDVGIGKTVEACLIARELMDRGEKHAAGRPMPAAPRGTMARPS